MPFEPVYVWGWLPGRTEPVVLGVLSEGGGIARFSYAQSYLARPERELWGRQVLNQYALEGYRPGVLGAEADVPGAASKLTAPLVQRQGTTAQCPHIALSTGRRCAKRLLPGSTCPAHGWRAPS
jgi:hypothetical protein